MSKVTMARTPEQQIENLRNALQGLQHILPMTPTRPARARRTFVRHALTTLDELELNLKSIEETGELYVFGKEGED